MQQLILSKFFICGLLIGTVSNWNYALVREGQMYIGARLINKNAQLLLAIGRIFDDYGLYLVYLGLWYKFNWNVVLIVLASRFVGVTVGRILFSFFPFSRTIGVLAIIPEIICTVVLFVK